MTADGHRVSSWGDKNGLTFGSGDVCTTFRTYEISLNVMAYVVSQ